GLSPDRFNPLPHDSQAWESLLGAPVAGTHRGLTPQIYDMPVVLQKNDDLNRRFAKINMHFFFFENTSIYFLLFFIVEQTQANEHRL
ncbi:TPA: hypothetical protein ACL9H0_001997, partial [Streptococcus pneumoniae]